MFQQHQRSVRRPVQRAFVGLAGSALAVSRLPVPAAAAQVPATEVNRRGRPARLAIPAGVNRDDFYRDRYKQKKQAEPPKPKTAKEVAAEQAEAKNRLESHIRSLGAVPDIAEVEALSKDPERVSAILESNESRGLYLTDAPTGKGKYVSGFGKKKNEREPKSSIERVGGHAAVNGIAASANLCSPVPHPEDLFIEAEHPEFEDLEWIEAKTRELLANPDLDPAIRTRLENSSIDELREFLTAPVAYAGNTGGHVGKKVNTKAPDAGNETDTSNDASEESQPSKVKVRGVKEFDYYAARREELTRDLFEKSTPVADGVYTCGICRDMKGGRARDTRHDNFDQAFEHFSSHTKTISRMIGPYLPKHAKEFKAIDSACTKMSFNRAYDSTDSLRRVATGPCQECKPGKACELHKLWSAKEVTKSWR